MDAGLLDTLVKLASLGASGICIFAIFWVGWLFQNLPEKADSQRHKTLRTFMGMNIGIAVISAVTGIANAWFNANAIAEVKKEKVEAVATVQTEMTEAVAKVETEKEKVVAARDSLARDFGLFKEENQQLVARYKEEQVRNQVIATSLEGLLQTKEGAALETNADPRIKDQIKNLRVDIEQLKGTVEPE